ncbi:MAG: hypothetical protein K2K27_04205 [Muribaculaceae bacterium]|nr:hypothetical protein [Muribaculaceae bacterium]
MKKIPLLCLFFSIGFISMFSETKTYFLDSDWNYIQDSRFADYTLYIMDGSAKKLRVLNLEGKKVFEGVYTKLDTLDFSKNDFDCYKAYDDNGVLIEECEPIKAGKYAFTSYYSTGTIEQYHEEKDNLKDGPFVKYNPNGTIKIMENYKNGKRNGTCYGQSKDGSYKIIEYNDGEHANEYWTYRSPDGHICRYRWDNTLYLEQPKNGDLVWITDKNNKSWGTYNVNGITLWVNFDYSDEYGSYYMFTIILQNNTLSKLHFNPELIEVELKEKNGKLIPSNVLTAEDYLKKVKKSQFWDQFGANIADALNSSKAAYSATVSSSNLKTSAGKNLLNSNSASVSYNGNAAYQANLINEQRRLERENQDVNIQNTKFQEYLKPTILDSGECVAGVIRVPTKNKIKDLKLLVQIYGINYPFLYHFTKL